MRRRKNTPSLYKIPKDKEIRCLGAWTGFHKRPFKLTRNHSRLIILPRQSRLLLRRLLLQRSGTKTKWLEQQNYRKCLLLTKFIELVSVALHLWCLFNGQSSTNTNPRHYTFGAYFTNMCQRHYTFWCGYYWQVYRPSSQQDHTFFVHEHFLQAT